MIKGMQLISFGLPFSDGSGNKITVNYQRGEEKDIISIIGVSDNPVIIDVTGNPEPFLWLCDTLEELKKYVK